MSYSIIGLSVRISGCDSLDDFWQVLYNGQSLIQAINQQRWERFDHSCANAQNKESMQGMFLDDIDCFDRSLFSMSPPAAMFADPRQRLLLQSCWSAIEDAGLKYSDLAGQKVGVFVAQDAWYGGAYVNTDSSRYLDNQEFVIPGNNPCFLANRVSAFFNFHGPSLVFNTTCSSVNVALHQACESLAKGECDYALVGGVSLFHNPLQDRFECSGAEIASFSNDACGYRSSEGCGAFLLKKGSAEQDVRHSAYAVIKASKYNSGGKTNSFAQPSQAQLTNLLQEILKDADLTAEHIDYIEAHGIASQMGDAVEANALIDVFQRSTQQQTCYVSTIKPNIGHTHAASGIYSLLKVILCFKYEKIPAIRGFKGKSLNEEIVDNTQGLHFLAEPVAWDKKRQGDGHVTKRHALISSYGFSNVNAAIILTEADQPKEQPGDATVANSSGYKEHDKVNSRVMVCLSAQSEAQIKQKIQQLQHYIDERRTLEKTGIEKPLNIMELAYTLQVGREAMEYRWVAIVSSIQQLDDLLAVAQIKNNELANIYSGNTLEKNTTLEIFKSRPRDLDNWLVSAYKFEDLENLARLWIKGIDIQWDYCYGKPKPRRIHLPIYPFAKERYWLPEIKSPQINNRALQEQQIHPLLHKNTSDLSTVRFSSNLNGKEFFLSDHVVKDESVLPGVAYLEMAQAAIKQVIDDKEDLAITLKNITWLRPLIVDEYAKDVHIKLAFGNTEKTIQYEVYTHSEDEAKQAIIHAQGSAKLECLEPLPPLDIKQLRAEMTEGVVNADHCYAYYQAMGINYGIGHRGIQKIYLGDNQALAILFLPSSLSDTRQQYLLHPCLMDSALQTFIALNADINRPIATDKTLSTELSLPYVLENVEIFKTFSSKMYSWVRYSKGNSTADKIRKIDIDICDENGFLSVRVKGFSLRTLNTQEPVETLLSHKVSVGIESTVEKHVDDNQSVSRSVMYLKKLMSNVIRMPIGEISSKALFSSYGIDSIVATTLISEMEKDFGSLSKTLFFEHENIISLSQYLTGRYDDKLMSIDDQGKIANRRDENSVDNLYKHPVNDFNKESFVSEIIEKNRLKDNKELLKIIEKIKNGNSNDGALLEIWPYLFLSKNKNGYFHYLIDGDLAFATNYTGCKEQELNAMEEFSAYCYKNNLHPCYLNIFGGSNNGLEKSDEFLSVPVGVFQTIENIDKFSLAGKKMRRLRYAVENFKKHGKCKTIEYHNPDKKIDKDIQEIIYSWSKEKKVVNNVDVILGYIKNGSLSRKYRVFLTYLNDELKNVILIIPFGEGYLMDQEYYLQGIPLGGTEFSVVEIINRLAAEGRTIFSLGLTWGLFEEAGGFSDRRGKELLDNSTGFISNILQNGKKNCQYKNKYRPQNEAVYLYRHKNSQGKIIIQCLSQFFRKSITFQEVEKLINNNVLDYSETSSVEEVLSCEEESDVFFDATKVDEKDIGLDLISDSWPYLNYGFIRDRINSLANKGNSSDVNETVIDSLFGFPNCLLSCSGKVAERLFFQVYDHKKIRVLQNVLFISTLHNEIKAGFEPIEIPDPEIFDASSEKIFRGGLDIRQLQAHLEDQAEQIAMIILELCNNAAGGYPVSLQQIKALSMLSKQYDIPLVMDVTRIVRNAELIRQYEEQYQQENIWSIVKKIASYADYMLGSLCKDFGLNVGGIIAARDGFSIEAAKKQGAIEGGLVYHQDARLIYSSLQDRNYIEEGVKAQLKSAKLIHRELALRNIPAVQPGVGHCVLIRTDKIKGYESRKYPGESFLKKLFEDFGIRGGVHLTGNQKDTMLNQCIRLALPIGLNTEPLIPYLIDSLDNLCNGYSRGENKKIDTDNTIKKIKKLVKGEISTIKFQESSPSLKPSDESIAIVGLSGRYPAAKTLEEFWKNLTVGKKSITEIPQQRWDWKSYYHPNPDEATKLRKSYGKWGGFLDEYNLFDPLFFNISPREAESIDPQECLFLEESWKAMEDAGYCPSGLSGELRQKVGIFAGVTNQLFSLFSEDSDRQTSFASLANRVSHFMDLQGPSIPVDNRCASSLVAIHEACEYIRSGRGVMALAGAVNLNLHPSSYLIQSREKLLSRNSESAAFGKGGAGYVPGEGVGVVVLKSYQQAIQDQDSIYAVIRSTAVNHNGKMNVYGIANPKQQAAVIHQALEKNNIDPRTISYIESAASGSEMADAMEMLALTNVFSNRKNTSGDYRIGSVKPNIGHCEAAAGMSQLTKVILSLKHKTLTKTLVGEALNAQIDFDKLPFRLQKTTSEWLPVCVDANEVPRRAAIISSSSSGVNAAMIIDEYIDKAEESLSSLGDDVKVNEPEVIFILSAKNKKRLKDYVQKWIHYLENNDKVDPGRVSYTLQTGREMMDCRLALVISTTSQLLNQLNQWYDGEENIASGYFNDLKKTQITNQDTSVDNIQSIPFMKLADLWAQGHDICWHDLYKDKSFLKMSGLPTYPFFARKCWSELNDSAISSNNSSTEIVNCTIDKIDDRLVVNTVREIVNEILNINEHDDVDDKVAFSEIGFDSIKIATFIDSVNNKFTINLLKTIVFDYPTIYDLSLYISTQLEFQKNDSIVIEQERVACKDSCQVPDIDNILSDYISDSITVEQALTLLGKEGKEEEGIYALNLYNIKEDYKGSYKHYMVEAGKILRRIGASVAVAGKSPLRMIEGNNVWEYFLIVKFPDEDTFSLFLKLLEIENIHYLREQGTEDYIWTLYDNWNLERWVNA